MSSLGPQIAPATVFPAFDQGLGRAAKGLSNLDREQVTLGAVVPVRLFEVASLGAGLVNTAVQARFLLPGRTKIPKIVVYCSALSDLTGCSFNIVLGTTGAYTQGNVPGNDNSAVPNVAYNAAGQPTATAPTPQYPPGGAGIATNPAQPAMSMFAADVIFNATNFPGISTGAGTGASYGIQLVPASPDAVWPNTGLLTLRIGTTASTGSISNLLVAAYMVSQPLNATFPASNFPIFATPEPTIDY